MVDIGTRLFKWPSRHQLKLDANFSPINWNKELCEVDFTWDRNSSIDPKLISTKYRPKWTSDQEFFAKIDLNRKLTFESSQNNTLPKSTTRVALFCLICTRAWSTRSGTLFPTNFFEQLVGGTFIRFWTYKLKFSASRGDWRNYWRFWNNGKTYQIKFVTFIVR